MTIFSNRFEYPDQKTVSKSLFTHRNAWLTAARFYSSPGYNAVPVDTHCLGLHLGAPVRIFHERAGQQDIRVFRPYDMLFTPAGEKIEWAHSSPVDALYLYFDSCTLSSLAQSMGMNQTQFEFGDRFGFHDPAVVQLGNMLLGEVQQQRPGDALYLEALSLQISIVVLRTLPLNHQAASRSIPSQEPSPRQLLRTVAYIHERLTENLSLNEIAAVEHLTPYHFSRVFKQIYGISPHQYVIEQRLKRAVELLKHTRMTVSEIALEVGFATPSHLTRHFKRAYGVTPSQVQQD